MPAAKEVAQLYGLDYGDEAKDSRNLEKGAGILNSYLAQHPKKAQAIAYGVITKADALVLALKDKGFKLGKEQGLGEAQKRNEDLKRSAMEADTGETREGEPTGEWTVRDLMEYARKHNK